jgi:hypothetical protein
LAQTLILPAFAKPGGLASPSQAGGLRHYIGGNAKAGGNKIAIRSGKWNSPRLDRRRNGPEIIAGAKQDGNNRQQNKTD